jgi:hypothetical protein
MSLDILYVAKDDSTRAGIISYLNCRFDRKIVIYEMPHHGDRRVDVASVITNAHDAAISAMIYAKDADNSWYELNF